MIFLITIHLYRCELKEVLLSWSFGGSTVTRSFPSSKTLSFKMGPCPKGSNEWMNETIFMTKSSPQRLHNDHWFDKAEARGNFEMANWLLSKAFKICSWYFENRKEMSANPWRKPFVLLLTFGTEDKRKARRVTRREPRELAFFSRNLTCLLFGWREATTGNCS